MWRKRPNLRDERGYTLIELLVVILMIGILAAIAIPAFLNESGKALDANAKGLVNAAEVAAEDYATDNDGSYANLTGATLQHYDTSIAVSPTVNMAWVSNVTGNAHGYAITVTPPGNSAETFTVTRNNGLLTRSCTPATGINGGCSNGSW